MEKREEQKRNAVAWEEDIGGEESGVVGQHVCVLLADAMWRRQRRYSPRMGGGVCLGCARRRGLRCVRLAEVS